MKLFYVLALVVAHLLALAGCVPHTTGGTEVGVRTQKLGILGLFGGVAFNFLKLPLTAICIHFFNVCTH